MRSGTRFGDTTLVDTMMKDGLIDAFNDCHMGITGKEWWSNFLITKREL